MFTDKRLNQNMAEKFRDIIEENTLDMRDRLCALLDEGFDPNSEDIDGILPLGSIIGDYDLVRLLIDRGADIHKKDRHYHTALDSACLMSDVRVACLLIGLNARVGKLTVSNALSVGNISFALFLENLIT